MTNVKYKIDLIKRLKRHLYKDKSILCSLKLYTNNLKYKWLQYPDREKIIYNNNREIDHLESSVAGTELLIKGLKDNIKKNI